MTRLVPDSMQQRDLAKHEHGADHEDHPALKLVQETSAVSMPHAPP